jgi:hypothetical protein
LHHFNPKRPLLLDADASKKSGIGAIVYHIEGDSDAASVTKEGKAMKFPSHRIQPIMFLSKLLSAAEHNYSPTELKVADIVWLVRKTRYLIESGARVHTAAVFTDHTAATEIARQTTTLMSLSTGKLNLRLIRASQYLSQFSLDVRYRPGKIHLVPVALSLDNREL